MMQSLRARFVLGLCRCRARHLFRDRHGTAAVEFGMVSMPFFALLGAIVQTAFMIWAQQNLDAALQRTVRQLFTGQFQAANAGTTNSATLLAALATNMCQSGSGPVATVFTCSGVKIDVTLGTSFASSAPMAPVDPSTRNWASTFGTHYTCAAPGAIVIATAAVKFPMFFGMFNAGLSTFSDGSALLQSTAVFRTEPFGTSSC